MSLCLVSIPFLHPLVLPPQFLGQRQRTHFRRDRAAAVDGIAVVVIVVDTILFGDDNFSQLFGSHFGFSSFFE